MGVSVQQWRATIGQWSGGRPGKCVPLQNHIAQTFNHNGYRLIRFLVLVSLLVIGCVELNPRTDNETPSPPQSAGALPKFSRRRGSFAMHGEMYEIKTAAFLFARALNRTEEFRLASNVAGAGYFDDIVFTYRLRKPNVWRTCFIQLKHKKNDDIIHRSRLKQMSGDFSLFKYFQSYCQIRREASVTNNLKECGNFPDFEFIIFTNGSMESKSAVKGGDDDPLSILSSGSKCGQYITFDKTYYGDIFKFFEELSQYHDFITEMDGLLNGGTFVDREINEKIKSLKSSVTSEAILGKLNSLKSMLRKDCVRRLKEELDKCDFSLFKEFLSKVKIFHSQSNERSFETLIKEELQEACQTSPSCAKSIYRKFYVGLEKWSGKHGIVEWLSENSHAWQSAKQYLIDKTKQLSESEIQKILGYNLNFKQQHIERLSEAIKQNTLLNIITNTNLSILSKLKTYQTLVSLGYKNSLFINSKTLLSRRKEVLKLWPCKWSAVLVIFCEKDSHSVDDEVIDTLVDFLRRYQQKLILISPRDHGYLASRLGQKFGNIHKDYEETCNFLDLDEESQKQILRKTVDFQGTEVTLETLVGTVPPEFLDSDVISILFSRGKKVCVGRKLGDHSKYSVPRVLEHHIYLKNDILKLTDSAITFAVSGVQADQLKKYLPAGEKICEFDYDESERSHSFKIVADFSKPGLRAEWGTMKTYHEIGQKTKTGEFRYILLRKTHPESDFRELKALRPNVHWIHMENGSFLWRESNCNIAIIRRYIDDTKCKNYDMKSVMEHNDRTMLLVAEPGMGKSTFLSYMEHEIKKCKPAMWVLRINLHEHTRALDNIENEEECIDNCKIFLWNAAHSNEQGAWTLERKIFLQALEQREKMFIILDGFDEISPEYTPKVDALIRAIIDKTASNVWVSSRFPYRQDLEDMVIKLAFTLQPFASENQIKFLEQYWNEGIRTSKLGNLRIFAKILLNLCSQNFRDKDGDFIGSPLQIMMLGEAFVKEAKEYCSSGEVNLPEKFNLLALFRKFTENKSNIHFSEENEMDSSKPEVKSGYNPYVVALMCLFSPNELNRLQGKGNARGLEQTKKFLRSGRAENFGIITDILDRKPHFIHRCFAEFFAAKWFAYNFQNCKNFITNTLFIPTYEVTRNIFDRMLAEDSEIHYAVLNNDIVFVSEFMKKKIDINISDKGGRTALHLAASYNSPLTKNLLSFQGVDANKLDGVLNMTPLSYAYRTKSWMAMDMLLQNGANANDIALTRRNIEDQEWGQSALWECASKGHKTLLDFMLDRGTDINAVVGVPENLHDKCTLLHRASFCGQAEVVRLLADRGADMDIRNANNDTALHFAAHSDSVDVIKLLLENGMSANWTNSDEPTPLHVSAACGNLEATKAFVEGGAILNNTNKDGDTPLMLAAYHGKLELVRYLAQIDADVNIRNANKDTALHYAAYSGSVEIIKLLLDKEMTVNLTNSDEATPLHVSAACGNLEATKAFVEGGAILNNTNKDGDTPLMLASYRGKLELVRYLAQIEADVNIRDATNDTALHYAAYSGSVEIIKLLLDKAMSVNLTNSDEATPLHISAACGYLEATKALVEGGAGLNNTNIDGDTPLMLAAYHCKLELVLYLIQISADINICDAKNDTVLHFAAHSDSVDIIKLLLYKGISVNLTNSDEATPLHVSAACGYLETTKTFVEEGAGLNNTNNYGHTPLMLAAIYGKLELVRYLTQIEADINIHDAKNYTALHYAAYSGSVEIIKLLLDKGMSVNLTNSDEATPLHISAAYGNLEATKAFVGKGAFVNTTDKYGNTPLMVAAYHGKLELVRYLTQIHADVNIRYANNNTALHYAAYSGSVEIIKLLIDKGMTVNLTNSDESTPLHVSAAYGNLEATKAFVEGGAGLNNTDVHGNTPLMLAAYNGKLEIVRYLTQIGADINITDANNDTTLHLAAHSDSVDIIKLLLDKGMTVNLTNSDEATPLHASAACGNLEATKTFVEEGAGLNTTDIHGNTPLMLAAYDGKLELFLYLIQIDADVNIRDANNNTALHVAAKTDCVDVIKLLLNEGMSANLTNKDGDTPLHVSASCGNLEATKAFVEGGAGLNNTNNDGDTPLMLAEERGKSEVVHYLKRKGAHIQE